MGAFGAGLKVVRSAMEKAGPYLLIELLLPGGTLLALLFFLYRRRSRGAVQEWPGARGWRQVRRTVLDVVHPAAIGSLWQPARGERDGLEALAMAPAA